MNPRLGKVGGQAVIEGVMMKGGDNYSVALRKPDGGIKVVNRKFVSVRSRHRILDWPIIRGIVNFAEMMKLSYSSLGISADAMGIDDLEPESKFEKWMDKKLGKHIVGIIMSIASVLGVILGIGLFFFVPVLITKGIDHLAGGNLGWWKNLIEGVIKIGIFIGYLALVSLMQDIARVFEYHGAEHKSIFCYEAGLPLTPENAKTFKRFHPRCGTSFLFVMLLLSILIYSLPFITWDNIFLRVITKLILLPVIVGIGYEYIRYAGRHENLFTKIVSAPGLWMQRITTHEPDESQLEVAICALEHALGIADDKFDEEHKVTIEDGTAAENSGSKENSENSDNSENADNTEKTENAEKSENSDSTEKSE